MGKNVLPVVSIVGRPNVGKSTLFNRILRRRQAVVDDLPGVTRDRHAAVAEWDDRAFMLVDTGGLLLASDGIIETQVRKQVEVALVESALVLLLVDGRTGPGPDDFEIADLLRRRDVRTLVVVTKVDGPSQEPAAHECAALGLPEMFLVSALHGRGMEELMDAIGSELPEVGAPEAGETIDIAVIGKPNVGKSSLVNGLLQEERMIVSEIPGTTRDSIDTRFRFQGRDLTLIDTAGLRRKSRVDTGVEYFSTLRAVRSLERADVAVVVLDASQPLARQDYRVAAMPFEMGRPAVFVFNKWDLVTKDTLSARNVVREATRHLPDFAHVPTIFVSAVSAQRISRIPAAVLEVYETARQEIGSDDLNQLLDSAVTARSHPYVKGQMMKFWGMRQVGVAPPTFIVYCNKPSEVEENYRRFLANRLRDRFPFVGTPVRFIFRRR